MADFAQMMMDAVEPFSSLLLTSDPEYFLIWEFSGQMNYAVFFDKHNAINDAGTDKKNPNVYPMMPLMMQERTRKIQICIQ